MGAILSDADVFGTQSGALLSDSQVFGSTGNTPKKIGPPEPMSPFENMLANVRLPEWMDNIRGSVVGGMMQGAADPAIGAAQLVANALPNSTGIPQAVNSGIAAENKKYEDARASAGRDGVDMSRVGGNLVSPANLVIASRAPAAASAVGRIAQGAGIGAVTSAMDPVEDSSNYWSKKAAQVGLGAITGAALAPVLGFIGDKAVRYLESKGAFGTSANIGERTDQAIANSLQEMNLGQTIHDIPPAQLQALRDQVSSSFKQGEQLDPAAALRKADFDALGIKPTAGQISRDPMQFAKEQNLRGVNNLGEPLSARFAEQGNQLQSRLTEPAAGASNTYQAGTQISDALKSTDQLLREHVSGLYNDARLSAGKDLEIPLEGLAQDYAGVLGDFGDKVPGAIRGKFAELGLDPANPSNQKKLFTIADSDNLLKVINAHVGNDPATNKALGLLRNAVKDSVTGADSTGGPFAPAVKAASERFKLQDAVPALKAASEGSVAPDDFVNRFIINGKTDDVKGLSQILQSSSPEAWQEARAQMADTLKRAAFGENAAGDSPFSPSRYMQQIRRLGVDKLGAFFTPGEVDDILRVGRVGTYIKQAPNAATVNTSNTAAAVGNLLTRFSAEGSGVPGAGIAVGLAKRGIGAVRGQADVNNALAAALPTSKVPLTPAQQNWLAALLGGGAALGGTLAGRQ